MKTGMKKYGNLAIAALICGLFFSASVSSFQPFMIFLKKLILFGTLHEEDCTKETDD